MVLLSCGPTLEIESSRADIEKVMQRNVNFLHYFPSNIYLIHLI